MLSIFKKKTAASAAEISAVLGEINIDTLRAALADAEASRAALLISGTDPEILASEAAITTARLAVDRGEAAKAELERRLIAAKAAEAKAALDAELAAVAKRADAMKRRLAAEYPKLTNSLADLLEALLEDEAAIEVVNAKLIAAGRPDDRLAGVQEALFGRIDVYIGSIAIPAHTSLPAALGSAGWPR